MKRLLAAALLTAGALAIMAADGPRVTRAALAAVEKLFDRRLEKDVIDNPFSLLGMTRGVYLAGYGAVFSAEVNLVSGPTISPFRPQLTKEEIARLRQRKLERLPVLRRAMREMLVSAAGSLDNVPLEERIVLGVSLFHHSWEDSAGLPAQIVMQAQRKTLVEFQTARRDRSTLDSVIPAEELF